MNRLIYTNEKHGRFLYEADTDEQWSAQALQILSKRFSECWYYDPLAPIDPCTVEGYPEREKLLALTKEEFDKIPTEALKSQVSSQIAAAKAEIKFDKQLSEWYQKAKKVVDEQDLSMITVGKGKWERQVPIAWYLLDQRTDGEYEQVTLVTFDNGWASL
jgi:hypothetical protein